MENIKSVRINKSTEGLLDVSDIINKDKGLTGNVVGYLQGKYTVHIDQTNEEKHYSLETLKRNWQIIVEEDDDDEEVNMEQVLIEAEVVDEEEAEEEKIEIQIDDENHIEDLKGVPTPIASDDIYIFDNKAEKVGKVNVTGHIYNIPVKADNINQTTMWKVLMELYKNRANEEDVFSIEQKVLCVKTLKVIDKETFEGAYKCLVSKTKKEYIDSLLEV